MSAKPAEETPLQRVAGGVFGLSIVFAVMEMTPGWGLLGLDWPPAVFCLITAVVGAVTGWVTRPGYRIPGLVAGAVAGPGAILVMYLLIHKAERVPIAVMLVAAFIGMLPAIGIFKGLAAIQDAAKRPSNS